MDTVSFASINVDKDNAKMIRNIKDLPCAICRQKMLTEDVFETLTSSFFQGSANTVLKKMKPYVKYMRKTEREAYNKLLKAAAKHQEMDLQTLVKFKRPHHLQRLEQKQLKIINDLNKFNKQLSYKSEIALKKSILKAKEIIFLEESNKMQKRTRILNEFKKLALRFPEKKQFEKILLHLEKLPSSKNDIDAFFVKYSTRCNREIGRRLLTTGVSTLDHITARHKGGKDEFTNLIPVCSACNLDKETTSFPLLILKNPKIPKNIQYQMDDIIRAINNGILKGLEDYPEGIKNKFLTITQKTKNIINLDISKLQKTHTNNPNLI